MRRFFYCAAALIWVLGFLALGGWLFDVCADGVSSMIFFTVTGAWILGFGLVPSLLLACAIEEEE